MKIYLSKQGIKELRKKISKLEHEMRMLELELRNDDVREDSMRQNEVMIRLETVQAEIAEKRFQLHNAKILPKRKNSVKVALGSFVELLDKATGKIFKYQLVESLEADPLSGRISAESPLGQSLLGRTVNEMISWSSGLSSNQMQLVAIG
ncbi:MAG: GreA/GreB family elongation factor [bacterium]|nr:GreA/GreB family elongation factor [bacterium]